MGSINDSYGPIKDQDGVDRFRTRRCERLLGDGEVLHGVTLVDSGATLTLPTAVKEDKLCRMMHITMLGANAHVTAALFCGVGRAV